MDFPSSLIFKLQKKNKKKTNTGLEYEKSTPVVNVELIFLILYNNC